MYFQVLDYKGKNFLNLNDNNNLSIWPTDLKEGAWLKHIGHSNSLCIYITRAITNHASISEYYFRFFPEESFACLCSDYPIETRNHILHECKQYRKYWSSKRDSLKDIIAFLKFNPEAFFFHEGMT